MVIQATESLRFLFHTSSEMESYWKFPINRTGAGVLRRQAWDMPGLRASQLWEGKATGQQAGLHWRQKSGVVTTQKVLKTLR